MIQFSHADEADQQFATVMNGRRVTLRLRYNVTTDRWSIDVSIDDLPVLHGRRVVTGIDLLEPFDLGIGMIFAASVMSGVVPDRTNLPAGNVLLFHATEADVEAAA